MTPLATTDGSADHTALRDEAAQLVHGTVLYAETVLRIYGEGPELAEAHAMCDAAFDLWSAIVTPHKRMDELGLLVVAP